MTEKEALQKALVLLGTSGENWVKGNCNRGVKDPFCVYSALSFASAHGFSPSYVWLDPKQPLVSGARTLLGALNLKTTKALADWNDDPARTWSDVADAFGKALSQC